MFDSDYKWRAALAAAGVTTNLQLRDPDQLAAGMPEIILRPWEFRVMNNLFGMSDDAWSVVVQGLGLLIAFVFGILTRSKRSPIIMAIVLGLVVDIVAMMIIAGEGRSAFVGLLGFPILFYIAAVVGKVVRRLVVRIRATAVLRNA